MPDLGIEPAKLPNIRLDTLQKTGLLDIRLHQLGLLTSELCPDILKSLYKVINKSSLIHPKSNTDICLYLSKSYIKKEHTINGSIAL